MWASLVVVSEGKRCEGTTRQGRRCAITSRSDLVDHLGRRIGEPLARGGVKCMLHMELFCVSQARPEDDAEFIVFFLDFESTGLDVLIDEIVEIGVLEPRSGAAFATTVRPERAPVAQAQCVHGIDAVELQHGPPFEAMFLRLLRFLDGIAHSSLVDPSDSESDGAGEGGLRLKYPSPEILLCAHNGPWP